MSRAPLAPSLSTEIIAGLTTFLTMSYIIVVNPAILSSDGVGLPFSGVLTATVLLSAAMTIAMGLYARLPYAVAPGMGLNAYFTFTVVLGRKIPAPVALGLVTWAGLAFLVVSVTPLRAAIARAVPRHLRVATAVGIGLFLAFIGLRQGGLVEADPVILVRAAPLGRGAVVFAVGFGVSLLLLLRRSALALLGGMIAATVAALLIGHVHAPATLWAAPDFSLLGALDLRGALRLAYLPILIAIALTDLFDSLSTFVGIAEAAGLTDERGEPVRLSRALVVDAIATFVAGLVGTSAGTAYVESVAGIRAGGRSGRVAVVAGLCFLPFLFLGPLARLVPPQATAPVLVLVGAFMFRGAATLVSDALEETLPAFATLLVIPLTSSIATGMLVGLSLHLIAFIAAGRRKELSLTSHVLGAAAMSALVIEYVSR
jgi:AGZA family xanthine/uracil permease-like MFS transporter